MCEKLHTAKKDCEEFETIETDRFWESDPISKIQNPANRAQGLIRPELADPKCHLSELVIHQINQIFEHDHMSCQDPREYCITHLLEAVHTSLVSKLSRQ
jgi:hypothetical protein